MRYSHYRNMAMATGSVEWAQFYQRREDPIQGWQHVQQAIKAVVRCGCPRDLWDEKVQDMIKDA